MIKKISSKQQNRLREYSKVRKEKLEEASRCEAKLSNCTYWAVEIHHKKGRIGNNLTDKSTFLSVCRNCHNWIEEHPKEAKEMDLSNSRI